MEQRNLRWKDTFSLLEENIGKTLEDIGLCKNFLNRTPTAQYRKQQIGSNHVKKLLHSKEKKKKTKTKMKRQGTE